MNLKWSQHFQKQLVEFEGKYKSSRTHLSPLGYALNQKIIPPDQYIKWAQNMYHLPVISDDYFNTHLPSIEDWKAWKSEYPWNEEIVPIGLWDGHLLVACLEIPPRFPASLYPVFLLADFKHTQRTYQFYINSEKGSESAKKIKELIQQPDSSAENIAKKEPEILELSDMETPDEVATIEESPLLDEQPEGLNLNFEIAATATKNNLSALPSLNEISFESLDSASAPQPEEISLKFTNVEVNSSLSQKKSVSENTSGLTNSGGTGIKAGLTMTSIGKDLPSNVQSEINSGLPYFIALKKDNPTNFENLTQGLFAKATNLFDKFILIAIDASEQHAVPVSWTDTITPRSKDIEQLNLAEPSIFKTVATTLKSYHGYIVLNESNEKFFEFWNQGQVPGNVTMVPLIVSNKLVGLWMGLGESNTYTWNTLRQMEAKGKEMCEAFHSIYKDSDVAA